MVYVYQSFIKETKFVVVDNEIWRKLHCSSLTEKNYQQTALLVTAPELEELMAFKNISKYA